MAGFVMDRELALFNSSAVRSEGGITTTEAYIQEGAGEHEWINIVSEFAETHNFVYALFPYEYKFKCRSSANAPAMTIGYYCSNPGSVLAPLFPSISAWLLHLSLSDERCVIVMPHREAVHELLGITTDISLSRSVAKAQVTVLVSLPASLVDPVEIVEGDKETGCWLFLKERLHARVTYEEMLLNEQIQKLLYQIELLSDTINVSYY